MRSILESPDVRVDGFIGPAHVSTVIGSQPYLFVAEEFNKPIVIAGFEPLDVMQAILMLVRQINEGRHEVENQYARAVKPQATRRPKPKWRRFSSCAESFEWRGPGDKSL